MYSTSSLTFPAFSAESTPTLKTVVMKKETQKKEAVMSISLLPNGWLLPFRKYTHALAAADVLCVLL